MIKYYKSRAVHACRTIKKDFWRWRRRKKQILDFPDNVRKMTSKTAKRKRAVSQFPRQHHSSKYGAYRLLSGIGFLIILGLFVLIGAQYIQQYRYGQELLLFEQKVSEQKARQEELKLEIERLQHIDYLEVLARDRLGLVKPGEVIFQLKD